MSYFGAKLAELLERKGMRAAELSRVTKIDDGLISKWINGQQKFVSNDNLAELATAISSVAKDRAELVRAHLLDEIAGPGSELIEIRIKGQSSDELKEDRVLYHAGALPLKLLRAFELLAKEAVTDADVRAVVLGLANVLQPESNSGHRLGEEYGDAALEKHEQKDRERKKQPEKPAT